MDSVPRDTSGTAGGWLHEGLHEFFLSILLFAEKRVRVIAIPNLLFNLFFFPLQTFLKAFAMKHFISPLKGFGGRGRPLTFQML